MTMIGYARVSTIGQSLDAQLRALKEAGCISVYEETASGGQRARRELDAAMRRLRRGDGFVVTKIDRVARSLRHLIEIIDDLTTRGVAFRSLGDPIDTATASGRFTLQILGAVAEFERALIRDRTITGLQEARKQGRVGGNPRLRARDRAAIGHVAQKRRDAYADHLVADSISWLPLVNKMRPARTWNQVLAELNRHSRGAWTLSRLKRSVRAMVDRGLAPPELLSNAKRRSEPTPLVTLVASIAKLNPEFTLAQIGAELESMQQKTPRGESKWHPASVRHTINQAKRCGLLAA